MSIRSHDIVTWRLIVAIGATSFAFALGLSLSPFTETARAECSNGGWSSYGGQWTNRRFRYATAIGTFIHTKPYQRYNARRQIIKGHNAWDKTHTDCRRGDQNNVLTDWSGNLECRYRIDDVSCVDFGPMGPIGCSGALACARNTWTADGAYFGNATNRESDQRYSTDNIYWWTYDDAMPSSYTSTYYDLRSVATHETGHSIGLGHYNSTYLTMHPSVPPGTYYQRTLGRGDIIGMRRRYPRVNVIAPCYDGCEPGLNPVTSDNDPADADGNEAVDAVGEMPQ